MKDEEVLRNLKNKILGEINIDNDRLILYTVDLLEQKKIEATFDKIVVTAFKLFPQRFSLIGFAEYPDGKRIHDCLFHCIYKPKNWLLGNAQSGYKITERGKYFLDETNKMLEGKIKVTRKYGIIARRKELTFINLLKKTSAYNKYLENRKEDIGKNKETKKMSQQIKLIVILFIWSAIIFMIIYLYKRLEIPNISEIVSFLK